MEIEIKIPNVGESVQEAVLVEWYKKDGDTIQKDDPLFVVETDKVTLEIVAEVSGVLKIRVSEGETVAIGTVVGIIDTEGAPATVELSAEKASIEPELSEVRQIIPPSVRRLVAEKNLDITAVTGTGPGNRITKSDVLLYLEQAQAGVQVRESCATGNPETSGFRA